MSSDKVRAEFEAWANSFFANAPTQYKRDDLPKDDPNHGDYASKPLQAAWMAWQASRAAPVVEQKPADRPEVVAWRWRKPIVNDHGETVGGVWKLGGAPAFLPWWTNEPLVRLTDYEALKVECEKLAESLEWLRGAINCTPENDKHQSGAWISTSHPRIRQIDELLVAYHKQGR